MRRFNSGIFALLVVGGYYLWRNRFAVQRFLESQGINVPLSTGGNISDTIRSGVAKVTGRVEHETGSMNQDVRRAS